MSNILQTLGTLAKPLLLSKEAPKIRIDDWTFRIHYRLTALLFILCSAFVCMKEYLGDHIKCVHMQEDDEEPVISRKIMETYCFITTTFTVPYDRETSLYKMDQKTSTSVGGPGYIEGKNDRVFHAYYQWVPFYLFFMGILFATPHAIWKAFDGNKVKHLVQDLNVPELPVAKSTKARQISMLANYLVQSRGEHFEWAATFICCEFLNIFVLGGCMYLTDVFLGKEFSSYGPEVLQFLEKDPEDRIDPMAKVFPRVTKCNINTYGPSGSIQRLACAGLVTLVAFIYRVLTLLSLRIRC